MENLYDKKNLIPLLKTPSRTVRRRVSRQDNEVGKEFSHEVEGRYGGTHAPRLRQMTIHFVGTAGDSFGEGLAAGITFVADAIGKGGCAGMHGGRALILSFPGEDFGEGMTGGCAYAMDPDGILAETERRSVQRLQPDSPEEKEIHELLKEHMEVTSSELAGKILDDWKDNRGKFVKVCAKP